MRVPQSLMPLIDQGVIQEVIRPVMSGKEAEVFLPATLVLTLAIVPPNVTHSGRAVTECRIIDVFHPVRDDYR